MTFSWADSHIKAHFGESGLSAYVFEGVQCENGAGHARVLPPPRNGELDAQAVPSPVQVSEIGCPDVGVSALPSRVKGDQEGGDSSVESPLNKFAGERADSPSTHGASSPLCSRTAMTSPAIHESEHTYIDDLLDEVADALAEIRKRWIKQGYKESDWPKGNL